MPDFRRVVIERLGSLRLRPEREAEVVEEIAGELLSRYEDALRSGRSPEDAERIAVATIGDWSQMAREIEQANAAPPPELVLASAAHGQWTGWAVDVRYALRQLRRSPALALLASVTLALAIGANTAIYSVVNAVLIKALPYPEAGRLYSVDTARDSEEGEPWTSLVDSQDLRSRVRSFDLLSAVSPVWHHTLMFESAEFAEGLSVSAEFADLTGVRVVAGRFFSRQEDQAGSARVAVISTSLALRRFGSQAAALGKALNVDGFLYSIVGVMTPTFEWVGEPVVASASNIDVWTPIGTSMLADRGRAVRWTRPVARLRSGISPAAAREELAAVSRAIAQQYPDSNAGFHFAMRPLKEAVTGASRLPLILLLTLVGFVLLIACSNIANLLLARSIERSREMTVRIALGASPSRIARLTLLETGLIAITGGIAGVGLAALLVTRVLPAYAPVIPRHGDVSVSWAALAFSAAVTIMSAVLTATAPLLYVTRLPLADSIRDGGRGATARSGMRTTLVAAQLALSLVLLTTAGLLAISLQRLLDVNPGFVASETATMSLKLPPTLRADARLAKAKQLQELIRGVPGIESVSFASRIPMMGQNLSSWLWIEGRPASAAAQVPEVEYRVVSENYFSTLGIPLKAGRLFDSSDESHATDVVVVNEAVESRYFPGENPIGKRVRFSDPKKGPWVTIVGVVGDIRHFGLDLAPRPEIYRPYAVNPLTAPIAVVRSRDPRAVIPQVAAAIRAHDPLIPVFNSVPMQGLVDRSTLRRRLPAMLAIAFAVLAVAIAAVGLAGVAMNSVRQRRREFGVRLALGATAPEVITLVMKDNLRTLIVGAAIGVPVAVLVSLLLRTLLYSTSPSDPAAWVGAPVVLGVISAIACWLPARRAARIDPAEILRSE